MNRTKTPQRHRQLAAGRAELSGKQREQLQRLLEYPEGLPRSSFHEGSVRVLLAAEFVVSQPDSGDKPVLMLTESGRAVAQKGSAIMTSYPPGSRLQAYGAGDGCISFTWAAPLRAGDHRGPAGSMVDTGQPVTLEDLTPEVILQALGRGSESPSDWLVHDGPAPKLVPVVTRVGDNTLCYRGETYRYEGWGEGFRIYVEEPGIGEIEDQSGRRNVLANFVEMESQYANMKPLRELLAAGAS